MRFVDELKWCCVQFRLKWTQRSRGKSLSTPHWKEPIDALHPVAEVLHVCPALTLGQSQNLMDTSCRPAGLEMLHCPPRRAAGGGWRGASPRWRHWQLLIYDQWKLRGWQEVIQIIPPQLISNWSLSVSLPTNQLSAAKSSTDVDPL